MWYRRTSLLHSARNGTRSRVEAGKLLATPVALAIKRNVRSRVAVHTHVHMYTVDRKHRKTSK